MLLFFSFLTAKFRHDEDKELPRIGTGVRHSVVTTHVIDFYPDRKVELLHAQLYQMNLNLK